jgi:hypothetical protein
MTDLPEPLTTDDVDLRNFPDMPLDVARLRDSNLRRKSSGDEFKTAIMLWCAAWHQKPAGSLPNDDEELADLAFYGTSKAGVRAFLKVKAMAMRGWILASDNRWYHARLADKAMSAWRAKLANKERTIKARIASLVKALSQEQDEAKRMSLQHEHDKLLSELSHTLSQGSSQPPIEGKGRDRKGSEGIGAEGKGSEGIIIPSTSPPSPSAPTATTTNDDDARHRPVGDKPLSRKARGMQTAALRLAIGAGDPIAVVRSFLVETGHDDEWRRETDGMVIGEIAAILAWRMSLKEPVRFPSGFRAARTTWFELKLDTRKHLAAVNLSALGIDHGIKPVEVPA